VESYLETEDFAPKKFAPVLCNLYIDPRR